jgi:hypothetical protein
MEEKVPSWDSLQKVKILRREKVKEQEGTLIRARPSEDRSLDKKSHIKVQTTPLLAKRLIEKNDTQKGYIRGFPSKNEKATRRASQWEIRNAHRSSKNQITSSKRSRQRKRGSNKMGSSKHEIYFNNDNVD